MKIKLKRDFYLNPTLQVAKDLIGKFLIHKKGNKIYQAQIIETEAYSGFNDMASHAAKKKQKEMKLCLNKEDALMSILSMECIIV